MKALTIALMSIALAAAPATWAQNADTPQAAAPAQAEQSLTGCLDGRDNAFTLKTSTGTVALQGDGLDQHVGKTIRVTGAQSTAAGKPVFKVTDIEVVSPRCQA
jgi:hypothetical protein